MKVFQGGIAALAAVSISGMLGAAAPSATAAPPTIDPGKCIEFGAPFNDCIMLGTSEVRVGEPTVPQAVTLDAVAVEDGVAEGEGVATAAATTCKKVRVPLSFNPQHGRFSAHAANGAYNAGFADAEPLPDNSGIVLRSDATSTAGNDATSWAHGATGIRFDIRNSGSTSPNVISASIGVRTEGVGSATAVGVSAGNLFGIEFGGSASSRGDFTLDAAAVVNGNTITGQRLKDKVVVDSDTHADVANTEVSTGEARVTGYFQGALPTVSSPANATTPIWYHANARTTAKAVTGGLGRPPPRASPGSSTSSGPAT